MNKIIGVVYLIPAFIVAVIILYYLYGFQMDSERIYGNFLSTLRMGDHMISKMLYVVYIFIICGVHILASLFFMILNGINKRFFLITIAILLFLPVRILLAFMLQLGYLPISLFEFFIIGKIISYDPNSKKDATSSFE